MSAADLPEIEDIKRVALAPGDVLLVRTLANISHETADLLKKMVSDLIPGHEIIVLAGGSTIDVIAREHVTYDGFGAPIVHAGDDAPR